MGLWRDRPGGTRSPARGRSIGKPSRAPAFQPAREISLLICCRYRSRPDTINCWFSLTRPAASPVLSLVDRRRLLRQLLQLGHRAFQSACEALGDLVDLAPRDAERRRERGDFTVGQSAHLHALFERLAGDDAVGLALRVEEPATLFVGNEFDRNHQAGAANIADKRIVPEPLAQLAAQIAAHGRRILDETLALHYVEI